MSLQKQHLHCYSHCVLLIGGVSGSGKTTIAKQLGLHLGWPWLQVDDLRLALQWSRVSLPERTKELYFFLETPHVWQLEPERLCNALIAVGKVLSPAIEIVVDNHISTAAPIILEGDGILPSLFARPLIHSLLASKQIQTVFLVESEEDKILANILARGRGTVEQDQKALYREAQAKWLYGQWLIREATSLQLPILEARPWSSLMDRILATGTATWHKE